MNMSKHQLWDTLAQENLVQGEAPETEKLESPWYVKTLLAFSGWFAALFLLGFIGVGFAFIMQSSSASIVTGALMIAGAFATLRAPKNEFFEHLALALSFAGQFLIIMTVFKITHRNDALAWVFIAMLQIPLAIIMPNFVHRVFSAFFAGLACSMVLGYMGAPYIFQGVMMFFIAWIWLNEFKHPEHITTIQPIAYGLTLCLMTLKGMFLFNAGELGWRKGMVHDGLWTQPWMGELLIGIITLYIIWQLLQRYGHAKLDPFSIAVFLGALLLCAFSMQANGITVGIAILLLGFAGSNRVLLGLGVVSLLFYMSSYYYLLDATLLDKSQTLFIIGLVMLSLRWLIHRKMPSKVS